VALYEILKPFNGHIKTAEQRAIIQQYGDTLAVDGRAVTFGTARRGLGGLRPRPVPSYFRASLWYQFSGTGFRRRFLARVSWALEPCRVLYAVSAFSRFFSSFSC